MEIRILREEILNPLQKVQPLIEKRSTMPILSHVLLDAKENSLDIFATDLLLAFKGTCKPTVSQPGKIVVHAKALYEIIRNLNCEEIYLRENENQWLEIKGGNSFFSLASLPVEEFPSFPEIGHFDLVSISGELLNKAITKTYFSMAKEELDTHLAGLCCEKIDKKLRFVSTDRFRLTYMEIPFEDTEVLQFEKNIMIPKKAVLEILRLNPRETLEIGFDNSAGVIKIPPSPAVSAPARPAGGDRQAGENGDLLYIRLMENRFPQYQHIIPEKNEYEAKIPKAPLKDILRRMNILVDEKNKVADFLFTKDKLTLFLDNPEMGKAQETLEIEVVPGRNLTKEMKFIFNISYLLDILNVLDSEIFIFGLNTAEKTPCVITGENDLGFKAFIVPIMEKKEDE